MEIGLFRRENLGKVPFTKHCFVSVIKMTVYIVKHSTYSPNLFFLFVCLFIYSHVHTLFGPSFPPAPPLATSFSPTPFASRQSLFYPLLQFCWREDTSNNKKDKAFLLVWDKDSYTERFLALLPCTCVLQPELIHLYLTSGLLPGHLPIVTSISLRLLY
jgi:hypothetical protein